MYAKTIYQKYDNVTNICVGFVTVVYNGFIYIFGGYNIMNKIHLNDINRYDPVGCTWKKILPIGIPPCPRKKQICHIINNKVFISGGNSPRSSNFPIRTIEVFDEAASDFLKHHNDLHVLDMSKIFNIFFNYLSWKKNTFYFFLFFYRSQSKRYVYGGCVEEIDRSEC